MSLSNRSLGVVNGLGLFKMGWWIRDRFSGAYENVSHLESKTWRMRWPIGVPRGFEVLKFSSVFKASERYELIFRGPRGTDERRTKSPVPGQP